MPNYLIDSHCHLHDQEWFTPEQAEQCLEDARAVDVKQFIVIGTDPEDSANARAFALAHDDVFYTYGVHPAYLSTHLDLPVINARPLAKLMRADRAHPKLVAIGEIGLDYHYTPFDRITQARLFELMLQLARDLKLPVSLHIREAFNDALPILDNFSGLTGVVHSFSGSKKTMKQFLARDFYIGVNGLATYSTVPLPPLEKMLLETDAPFLTPVPFRGKINTPAHIRTIADYIAEKLGVAEVNIAEQTTKNVQQLFHLQ